MSSTNGCERPKRVLMVGDSASQELQAIARWLPCVSQLTCFSSPAEALSGSGDAAAHSAELPDVIVIAASRPGQWTCVEVERLHHAWPLARLVALVGSWCEGEPRSGKPWPGVVRTYWYEFVLRVKPYLCAADQAAAEFWNLPRTATWSERLAEDLSVGIRRDARHVVPAGPHRRNAQADRRVVAIAAASRAAYEPLADACQLVGFTAAWHRLEAPVACQVAVGIWDARGGDDQQWSDIGDFARLIAPAPVVVTQGFPRWEDWQRAASHGVTALIAKPFQIPDLWRALKVATGDDPSHFVAANSSQSANHSTIASLPDYNHQEGTMLRPDGQLVDRKVY